VVLVAVAAMIYTHAAAALLAAAVATTGAWHVQSWRMSAQVQSGKTALETLKREHAESLTRATGSALNATIAWQKEKDDAIAKAQDRAKLQAAGALAARRSADRLRDSIATASVRLPDAAHTACTEYATAASGLLDQCTAAYQELGAAADGHALDVRTLTESWPVNPPRPDAGTTESN
jgi:hypothetical protein